MKPYLPLGPPLWPQMITLVVIYQVCYVTCILKNMVSDEYSFFQGKCRLPSTSTVCQSVLVFISNMFIKFRTPGKVQRDGQQYVFTLFVMNLRLLRHTAFTLVFQRLVSTLISFDVRSITIFECDKMLFN